MPKEALVSGEPDATRVGGAISLACGALMAYLFVSNISEYIWCDGDEQNVYDMLGDFVGEVCIW